MFGSAINWKKILVYKRKTPKGDGNYFSNNDFVNSLILVYKRKTPKGDGNCDMALLCFLSYCL